MPESIQTLVKHIGRINRNELNLQYTYVYAKLRYKNRARIFSSVVDSSLKKALVFCYDTDIYCYTKICGSSVQWRDAITVNYVIAKFVLP